MTITTNDARDEYTSGPGQTVFNYTFKIFASDELDVYVTPAGQEANDSTDLTTDYVVDSGTIGNEAGGFITFNTPLSSGDKVTIASGIPYDRTTDYQFNGDFNPTTVNNDNDRQTAQIKQVLELARKAVVFGQAQQGTSGLTSEAPEAGKYIRWKSDLSGFENVSPLDVGDGVVAVEDLIIVFDTVADMISDTSGIVTVGQTVRTRGYTAAGDGGDNLYEIVAAGTGTDDGGSFIDLSTHQAKALFPGASVSVKQFGATGDGATDDYLSVNSAAQYANTSDLMLYVPAGNYKMSDKVSITRPASDLIGFQMRGDGRGVTKFEYTGSNTFDYFFEMTATTNFSLNNRISGIGIDVAGSPDGTGGIKINAGVWRSKFSDLYIHRNSPVTRTGDGIFMGSATPGDFGSFDNKFEFLYISGFDKNLNFIGTDLSGNTITNVSITESYISNANTNIFCDYMNGFYMSGSQVESYENIGIHFNNSETSVIMGGSIESPKAGAIGVDMDANTKSVIAICDFFNNAGGNFLSNGNIGHQFKTPQSGFVYPPGSRIRIDSDGTDFAHLRFFEQGVADVKLQVAASSDAIAITDSSDVEKFKYNVGAGVMDVFDGSGYIRLQNGSEIRFLQSGITTRDLVGAGSPEGVVTANSGSIYRNRSGGAGTTLYVKESGSGNTGWVAK